MDEAANTEFTGSWPIRPANGCMIRFWQRSSSPTDHGFGTRRVPTETNYYEAYNRQHVHLVDINETPIECVTETGLRTSEGNYDVDLIVYATGFGAMTGAFDRIDFIGVDGQKFDGKWTDGPVTCLGLQTACGCPIVGRGV